MKLTFVLKLCLTLTVDIKGRKLDVLILILLIGFGIFYAFATKDLFIGKSVFGGLALTLPPTIYLGLRRKKNWGKISVATLVFGGLFGFVFEFFNEFNKAYTVISTIFPFKILGVLPLDNILGHMMMTTLTITFYEHFIGREVNHHMSKHLKFAVLPGLFAAGTILILFFFNRNALHVHYPYFYAGLAALIPPIYLGFRNPAFIKNMSETAIYFFFLWFVGELIAVRLGYWVYSGNNYVGWVTVLGATFPFEELFFWTLFYAASLVSYYELFIDDRKRSLKDAILGRLQY